MNSSEDKLSIYLSGGHSTGKTTLLWNLQIHEEFSKFCSKDHVEVARTFIESNGISPEQMEDPTFLFNMEKRVIELQHSAEENEISVIHAEAKRNLKILATMFNRKDCLIFVIKPHKETLERDDVRHEPEFESLELLHKAFITLLELQGIPYTEVTCLDIQMRTDIVVNAAKAKWRFGT